MNFGDILNQWDDVQRSEKQKAKEKPKAPQVSHKMANAPTKEEKEARRIARLKAEGKLMDDIWEKQMEADSKKQ